MFEGNLFHNLGTMTKNNSNSHERREGARKEIRKGGVVEMDSEGELSERSAMKNVMKVILKWD